MPQKACLKKPTRIPGLPFYYQFACQMPRCGTRNASALFSYILYLIVPSKRTPADGNFGGNWYKNCAQRFGSGKHRKIQKESSRWNHATKSATTSCATTTLCAASRSAG